MATHQGFSIRAVGARTIDSVLRLGYATRFIARTIMSSGTSLKRPRLVIRELYFTGVLSLIIILVSGLFVGMVLGYQGYYTLQTYGSESALGVLVALSLVRELGPVMAALLFASRAGSAMTAEIGLMKATEQLSAMEMMAVDPIARVVAPRFLGGLYIDATAGCDVQRHGGVRRLPGGRGADRGGRRLVLVADAKRGGFSERHHERRDQECGVWFRRDVDFAVRGLRRAAHCRGRVGGDHAHRGDLVAGDTGLGLFVNGFHVWRGLMQRSTLDLWVGLFVMGGIGALLVLAMKVGNMSGGGGGGNLCAHGEF